MGWHTLLGHDSVRDWFVKSHENNRLANTYLFVGPEGIGKKQLALTLAQSLLCETNFVSLEPCETCSGCIQVANQTHPDLILISKPADKNFIPVEMFLGDREHRRREGLCHDINLTPFKGERKIAVIDDADYLNVESANSLLKTLEEPPPNSILILIGSSEHRQLPTILSRAQVVRFQPLEPAQVLQILSGLELPGEVVAEKLAYACGGSVQRAITLDNKELFEFRMALFGQLATFDPAEGGYAKTISDFVDQRSKEAAVKRKFQRMLADFAIDLYSGVIKLIHTPEKAGVMDPAIADFALQIIDDKAKCSIPLEVFAANCIDRTIVFQRHVEANMAMANTIPSWLNDLGRIARNEKTSTLESTQN